MSFFHLLGYTEELSAPLCIESHSVLPRLRDAKLTLSSHSPSRYTREDNSRSRLSFMMTTLN